MVVGVDVNEDTAAVELDIDGFMVDVVDDVDAGAPTFGATTNASGLAIFISHVVG